jgi:GT2 family glycosyltransferase
MPRLTIGVVAYNGQKHLKLCLQSIRDTVSDQIPHRIVVVDGNSTDGTREWLGTQSDVKTLLHDKNWGFVAGINDLAMETWKDETTEKDFLLLMGSDTLAYPGSIDAMYNHMVATDYDWIFGREVKIWDFLGVFPQYQDKFEPNTYVMKGDEFPEYKAWHYEQEGRELDQAPEVWRIWPERDCRNFVIMRSNLFLKCGWCDELYWPNGYYEDNDYCHRAMLAKMKTGQCNSEYFHFWSRTAFEGRGLQKHSDYLAANKVRYLEQWGGMPGLELIVRTEIRKLPRLEAAHENSDPK